MKSTKDQRKKLLDLAQQYTKIENLSSKAKDLAQQYTKIKNLSSKLGITPESFINIYEGKETIGPELAQRIKELCDKEVDNTLNEEEKKIPLIRNLHGKKIDIDPEFGKRIDELWDSTFKDKDKEFIIGEEIQNKIDNYEKLKFFEKKLVPRDFNYSLYGLQDIPKIPGLGEQITIIDCNDGKEYPTNIQKNQHSISTGLKLIWEKFNRLKILKQGDAIGIAIDPENNHRIYVDFEYKERDKLDNQENQEKIRNNDIETTHKKYGKYAIAIEKSIPWIKEQIANSKDGKIRMRTKDIGKEMGPEFEKRNPTSIYWGLKSVLFGHGIIIDQDIHQDGDKLLILRSRTEKDQLPSPQKYIDGKVLQLPHLNGTEKSIEKTIEYDSEKEIEISLENRRYTSRNIYSAIRDNSFRYRILNVYKNRCAICGLQMNMVEACHIIPVEDDGTDEIINGIALCHNHHKAFDSGLIWVNEEYSIILNHSKIKDMKDANIAGGLDDFIKNSRIGEKIFLPDNHICYPDPDLLIKKLRNSS